MSNVSLGR